MFKIITFVAIGMALAAGAEAQIKPYTAPNKKDNPAYTQSYLVDGQEVTAQQAMMAALNGKTAMRCQGIELQLNKNGTGVSFKNVKAKVEIEK